MARLERETPPAPWIARIVIGLAIVNIVAGWIGDLLLAVIVEDDPLLLIALSPRDRNLALASVDVGLVPYFVVGFVRLVFFDPASFLLGFWYGDRALAWIRRRSRTYGPLVDDAQRGFRRWAAPLIFFFPNNIICMMAGASGVGVATFVALNVTGTIVRLAVIRQFGAIFGGQISSLVGFIDDNRIPILIVSALAVGWTVFGEFRGDNSEIQALVDLERERDDDQPGDDAGPGETP